MASIDITRAYLDGEILFASDVDAIIDAIETFLNVTKLTDDNISNSGITGSLKLVNASVTNAKLATDAVGTTNIVDGAVTTAKIAASAITTAKIADGAVTNAKIATDAVDSSNIVDGSVTRVKLAAPNYVISSSSTGVFNTTSATATAVTNASVTITLTGRPVLIGTMAAEGATDARIDSTDLSYTAGTNISLTIYIYKAGTLLTQFTLTDSTGGGVTSLVNYYSPSSVCFLDVAGTTGSTVYDLRCAITGSSTPNAGFYYIKLFAIEL